MRLWSLHPRYLDRQGLTAVWREGLLAQAVLLGRTTGYQRHPQLERFRAHDEPRAAIAAEATARGYSFDETRIEPASAAARRIEVADGHLRYEWGHLTRKLASRSPLVAERWHALEMPDPHPLFSVVPGPIASWERPGDASAER